MSNQDSADGPSWTSPGAGITAGYDGGSETFRILIVFFAALAMYNACELVLMVLLSFRRYRGTYFWSLIVAGVAIIPYSLGFMLKFLNITRGNARWLAVVLLTIGWWPMITGQSFVLWSRLHLIVVGRKGERILRWTWWMIVIDFFILQIPTTVLTFGSNGSLHTHTFVTGYNIMEKIQMVGFFLQEGILSSIYIVETVRILRSSLQPGTRRTMKQLILINAVIIVMDLGLLGLECASLYILETLIKGIVYSIKLKLEFAILGKLVQFVGGAAEDHHVSNTAMKFATTDIAESAYEDPVDVSDIVDLSRVSGDVTHATRARLSVSGQSRQGQSRTSGSTFDHDMARFEHSDNVATLRIPSLERDASPDEKG